MVQYSRPYIYTLNLHAPYPCYVGYKPYYNQTLGWMREVTLVLIAASVPAFLSKVLLLRGLIPSLFSISSPECLMS